VNPDHLEPVTAAINVRRGAVTKLSPGEVADIRATTATQRALAALYNVSQGHISRIKNDLTWRLEQADHESSALP
jgi:hypothetical protein